MECEQYLEADCNYKDQVNHHSLVHTSFYIIYVKFCHRTDTINYLRKQMRCNREYS